MPLRLNLGCGRDLLPISEGWVNVDISPQFKPDRIADLSEGLPWVDSESVAEIRAFDIVEHIPPWKMSKVTLFNELHRVLVADGRLHIRTPHPFGPGWYQDPTHVTVYGPESWDYFTGEHGPEFMISYGITAQFQKELLLQDELNMDVTLIALKPTAQEIWALEHR